jgi:hypothetical protein
MTAPARTLWLVYFLRFIAACQLLAFIAVFVPISVWLPGWYSWLRLGPAPEVSAVLRYVIGATAFFQAAIGVWLWIMLSDVVRYCRLLVATAVIYLVAVPIFYYIDAAAGLPLWWRMYDSIWCLIVSVALLMLCRRPIQSRPATARLYRPKVTRRRRFRSSLR